MKILVCDDQERRCKETVDAISQAGQKEVTSLFDTEKKSKDLTNALTGFFADVREYLALEGFAKRKPKTLPSISTMDRMDIVVIDNNLSCLEIKGARLTAESILGYLRAFSSAAYFISLNKNPGVDFDLRNLVGDHSTQADLALNTSHLGMQTLWNGTPGQRDRFAPSYWPALERVAGRRRAQIRWIGERLGKSVLGELGFPNSAIDSLSRHAIGAFVPGEGAANEGRKEKTEDPRKVTFRELFMNSTRSLPTADRRNIHDRNTAQDKEVMSRILASDLDSWIRRDVVGPQEAVVTVPHLLLRMPFLLGKSAANPAKWNAANRATKPPFGMDAKLYEKYLKRRRADNAIWFDRPCFWWAEIRKDEELNNHFDKSDGKWADMIYCEDISAFVAAGESGENSPREFVAEFEGTWERRHVMKVGGFSYSPGSRFAR